MPESTAQSIPPPPRSAQRVRIDQGGGQGSELAPGRGSLLRAFGAWGARSRVKVKERRAEARLDRVECKAWVGWKSWRQFHMNTALVINLSRGGAQIFLDSPPPAGHDVWVFLETPDQNTVVKGRVLEVSPTAAGQCAVRIAFSQPCPFAVFDTAVCGLAPSNPKLRPARASRLNAQRPR